MTAPSVHSANTWTRAVLCAQLRSRKSVPSSARVAIDLTRVAVERRAAAQDHAGVGVRCFALASSPRYRPRQQPWVGRPDTMRNSRPVAASRRVIATMLVVLGALVAFLGVTSPYLRTAVLSADTFADNTEQTLQSPQVQTFLASSLADRVAEESPELEAARPRVQAVALGVINDPTFQSTFRQSVLTLHQVVLDGKGEEVILDLQGPSLRSRTQSRSSIPSLRLRSNKVLRVRSTWARAPTSRTHSATPRRLPTRRVTSR